jgi:hypothetical protein
MNPVIPKLELLLSEVASWGPDAAICATGTTIKKAGSKEAFRSAGHDLPIRYSKSVLCLLHGFAAPQYSKHGDERH